MSSLTSSSSFSSYSSMNSDDRAPIVSRSIDIPLIDPLENEEQAITYERVGQILSNIFSSLTIGMPSNRFERAFIRCWNTNIPPGLFGGGTIGAVASALTAIAINQLNSVSDEMTSLTGLNIPNIYCATTIICSLGTTIGAATGLIAGIGCAIGSKISPNGHIPRKLTYGMIAISSLLTAELIANFVLWGLFLLEGPRADNNSE